MNDKLPLHEESITDLPHLPHDGTHEIAPDLAYRRLAMVNVIFQGGHGAGTWTLIDTGIPMLGGLIESSAAERFGEGSRPHAIVLTHGHFDHVGNVKELADKWGVPVYAHPLEFPYLTGLAAYPRVDPFVGGGIMPLTAPVFPSGPIDITRHLMELPGDGSIPGMPEWRWIHTPGHSPGHVSLWRETDRTLIAADAFTTTNMDSAYAVITQKPELHGPPTFLTVDWDAAKTSVTLLAELEPELVITGHGQAMHGAEMRAALHKLAQEFERFAVPERGHYVEHPAHVSDGSVYRT